MKLDSLLLLLPANASGRTPAVDRRTGQPPIIWRGNGAALRVTVFADTPSAASLITDWTGITGASLVVRAGSATGAMLLQKTLPIGSIDTTLTWEDYLAGEGHFEFLLSGAETNQTVAADGRLPIYFAADLSVSGGDPITVLTGTGEIREDGIGEPGVPPDPNYLAISEEEADLRYLQITELASRVVQSIGAASGLVASASSGDVSLALSTDAQASLALAEGAAQSGDLAAVAFSGDYDDLTGRPTLGTAATEAAASFEIAGAAAAAQAHAVQRENHTGTQGMASVAGLEAALDAKLPLAGGTVTGNILLPNATFGAEHALSGEQGDARYVQQASDIDLFWHALAVSGKVYQAGFATFGSAGVAGSGASYSDGGTWRCDTNSTTSSRAVLRMNYNDLVFASGAAGWLSWNFSQRIRIGIRAWLRGVDAGVTRYFIFGADRGLATWTDPAFATVGIKISGADVALIAHNGSTLTTSGVLTTVANDHEVNFALDVQGGDVLLFKNGVMVGSSTGAPTSAKAWHECSAFTWVENGATTVSASTRLPGPLWVLVG